MGVYCGDQCFLVFEVIEICYAGQVVLSKRWVLEFKGNFLSFLLCVPFVD